MSDDGDECSLCGGCGEVDATSATTPVPETVGCPLCIAVEKEERIAELERQLAEARDKAVMWEWESGQMLCRAEAAEGELAVWRDCFEEITAKAAPYGADDPIKAYLIPAGPIHRAAGKTGCQAFGMGERIAELERQLAEAESRIADLEAAAQDRFRGEWKTRVGNPFFKAAKAAADERMVALKLEARSNLAHAEDAERQLADMRAALGSAFTGLQNVGEHNSMTRAALADVKAALAQEPANQPLSGLIRDKDGRVRGMR
jgi:chaperonin cofactor prefoldin